MLSFGIFSYKNHMMKSLKGYLLDDVIMTQDHVITIGVVTWMSSWQVLGVT